MTTSSARNDDSIIRTTKSSKEEKKAVDQIDICAWFVHEDSTLGACVLAACEYKPSNTDEEEREAQADMYGSNILILHKKQCIVIDIAGANDLDQWVADQAGRFDLWSQLPIPTFPGGKHARAPLLTLAMTWYALRDRLGL